ncbi:MAG: hypothetical protein AB7E05_10740 [Sphingobium sp.]
MSATSDFYLVRADICAREARETPLANVRERSLRAEAAWRSMAQRLLKSEIRKSEQAAEKAATREPFDG